MSDEIQTHSDQGFPDSAEPEEPIENPGLPEHEQRLTDAYPQQERRAERQVGMMFGAASLLSVAFCVAYFAVGKDDTFLGWSALNFALGITLGLALLLIGLGAIQWAKKLMNDHEIVELRQPTPSTADERESALSDLNDGISDSGFGRRPLIRNTLLGAVGALGLPAIVMLRDMGPLPHGQRNTVWSKGMRVVNDISGTPIKPEDLEVGELVNGEPAVMFEEDSDGNRKMEGTELLQAKAKAAVIIVRIRPEDVTPSKGRENWGVDGILCYSKICTHVGCPISLWEQQTHHVLCPCHQSTFDLADNGKVIFGPAYRPLPQLPLSVDSDGYLIATSDFPDIIAPSYPELARDQKKLDEKA